MTPNRHPITGEPAVPVTVATAEHFSRQGRATHTDFIAEIETLRAQKIELIEALERLLHPMASEDDIDNARDALAMAKGGVK